MAGCDGPNGSRWDGERCVTGSQTSCDELNQTTCFYAVLQAFQNGAVPGDDEIHYLGGQFLDDGRFEVGVLVSESKVIADIASYVLLAHCGLRIGDKISHLNGKKIGPKAFMSFTPKAPALSARVCRGSDGSVELILRRTKR